MKCYNVQFCYNITTCQNSAYLAFCANCKDCFACCGLVGKQYHIFNTPYPKEEYEALVAQLQQHMQHTGEAGKFFPLHFAANPYSESLAGFHFPLSAEEQAAQGYRVKIETERRAEHQLAPESIPDTLAETPDSITQQAFWDNEAERPFRITAFELDFCRKQGIPLNRVFYIRRIKENFAWMYFDGELRQTTCAHTGAQVMTTLPAWLDGRILCEEAYRELITS